MDATIKWNIEPVFVGYMDATIKLNIEPVFCRIYGWMLL